MLLIKYNSIHIDVYCAFTIHIVSKQVYRKCMFLCYN